MTPLRGIATNKAGGVEIIIPMTDCVRALMRGGAISRALQFRDAMRDWLEREFEVPAEILDKWERDGVPLEIAMSWEVHKFIACRTWRPDLRPDQRTVLAWLWVRSLAYGGLTQRSAIELICAVSVSDHAQHLEIVDASEIPADRSSRDDWWRGHNGGPIWSEGKTQ